MGREWGIIMARLTVVYHGKRKNKTWKRNGNHCSLALYLKSHIRNYTYGFVNISFLYIRHPMHRTYGTILKLKNHTSIFYDTSCSYCVSGCIDPVIGTQLILHSFVPNFELEYMLDKYCTHLDLFITDYRSVSQCYMNTLLILCDSYIGFHHYSQVFLEPLAWHTFASSADIYLYANEMVIIRGYCMRLDPGNICNANKITKQSHMLFPVAFLFANYNNTCHFIDDLEYYYYCSLFLYDSEQQQQQLCTYTAPFKTRPSQSTEHILPDE